MLTVEAKMAQINTSKGKRRTCSKEVKDYLFEQALKGEVSIYKDLRYEFSTHPRYKISILSSIFDKEVIG